MQETSSLKSWLFKAIGITLILVISVALVILLAQFDIMRPYQSIMLGAVLFVSLTFLARQQALLRDVKMLKEQAWDLEEYERDMNRRLEAITPAKPSTNLRLEEELKSLSRRITQLDGRVSTMAQLPAEQTETYKKKSAMPDASMAPFHAALGVPDGPSAATSELLGKIDTNKSRSTTASMKAAIKENKLNLHLQPIVDLSSRKPAYFEAFMRLQTDEKRFMEARDFLKIAEQGGLMPAIDTKVVFASVRMLRTLTALKKKAGLFCNLSGKTLTDTRTFNQIAGFLQANASLNKFLILEISQRGYAGLKAKERARLAQLVDLGFKLSLDAIADLNLDGDLLAKAGFKFTKVPASILLHANVDDERLGIHPTRLSSVLRDHGIQVIATEIEQESQAIGLIDFDIPFGQGTWFAPPRPVKAELLDGTPKQETNSKSVSAA